MEMKNEQLPYFWQTLYNPSACCLRRRLMSFLAKIFSTRRCRTLMGSNAWEMFKYETQPAKSFDYRGELCFYLDVLLYSIQLSVVVPIGLFGMILI